MIYLTIDTSTCWRTKLTSNVGLFFFTCYWIEYWVKSTRYDHVLIIGIDLQKLSLYVFQIIKNNSASYNYFIQLLNHFNWFSVFLSCFPFSGHSNCFLIWAAIFRLSHHFFLCALLITELIIVVHFYITLFLENFVQAKMFI